MNLPNKLSLVRIGLIPFMILFFYINIPYHYIIATAIFTIAAATDFLDGYIARKNNLVTDFGKFIDPIADKALVMTALILIVDGAYIAIPYFVSICLIIVLIRELMISALRMVASNNGKVIAADKLGKAKTVSQIIALIFLLILPGVSGILYDIAYYVGVGMLVVSTLLTIISGVSYLVKNFNVFDGKF